MNEGRCKVGRMPISKIITYFTITIIICTLTIISHMEVNKFIYIEYRLILIITIAALLGIK